VRSFWIQFFKDRFKTSISSLSSVYLCGKAGSGKTSCAEYLIKKGYQVAKFASPVYMIAEKYFNMKNKDRKLLQIIGTDIGRRYDSDIWINRFLIDMRIVKLTKYLLKMQNIPFVCDDVRFKNEHKKLKKEGWIGIYLDVSDDIRINRLNNRDGDAKIECLNHKSETEIDSFKDNLIKLDASGSMENTISKLKIILNIKN
jgi:dephospho-CoA kinase